MSQEQLTALLAKLQEDSGLQEKFKGAPDLDALIAIAEEAGFEVSKDDLLDHQAAQRLSDEEVDEFFGGQAVALSLVYC